MLLGLALAITIQADGIACKLQPSLPWCEAHASGSLNDMKTAQAVETQARLHFSYQDDPAGQNIWRSRLNDIGNTWRGNCDQLTFTELEMLAKQGWDTTKMWRVIVSTPENMRDPHTLVHSDELHMIGLVEDSYGRVWAIADVNMGAPYIWSDNPLGYKVVYSSKVSNGLAWNKGSALDE